MWRLLRVLCTLLGSMAWLHGADCGYLPQRGKDSEVVFGSAYGQWYSYPETVSDVPDYFISGLNFNILDGLVFTGAADKLYILNSNDLSHLHTYPWPASQSNISACMTGNTETEYSCRNHIRVYRRLPSNASLVLVCGTQATVDPQCRVIQVTQTQAGVSVTEYLSTTASDGIISYYPEFSQFGEFRNSDDSDTVYFSAGFFQGDTGAGRHFSISYQNITLATPSDPDSLQTTELFRTISANNNWLRLPVTFVGSYRADYAVTAPATTASDYQFWFVFLRENLVSSEVIYSRLVRICRNDPGSTVTSADGANYFTTYMKARIFCERDKPSGLEFTGTLDYQYNSITSFAFSQEGRYYGNGVQQKLLYGTFTGPINGPVASALCVYPADNTAGVSGGTGRSNSAFDIFREDVLSELGTGGPTPENTFVECAPQGRLGDDQQLVFINPEKSVEQIGNNPLLVLDDVIITQMVRDSVCVVTRADNSSCVNQDVLFLGLDSGHVLKVVFGTDEIGASFPIIAEDIQLNLEGEDPQSVTSMDLRQEGDEKFLYVSMKTRVHKLPLHRCGRFQEYMCSDCIATQDPYCVYNVSSNMCIGHNLTPGDVPIFLLQNIHTGVVDPSHCSATVSFNSASYSVNEGAGSVVLTIVASKAISVTVATQDGTADGQDYTAVSTTISISSSLTALLTIPITNDVALETNQEFTVQLSGPALFSNSIATVTIIDDDGTDGQDFQVGFLTGEECKNPVVMDEEFISSLVETIAAGVVENCAGRCEDFSPAHIIKQRVVTSCDTVWYLTLQGEMLATETAGVGDNLLPALAEWVLKRSKFTVGDLTLTTNCSRDSTEQLCISSDKTPSGLSSSDGTTYSEGAFASVLVLFFIAMAIAVVVVLFLILLFYQRKTRYCNRVSMSRAVSTKQSESLPVSGTDGSTPQTSRTSTPKFVQKAVKLIKGTSYEEAQSHPVSSLTHLVTQRTISEEGVLEATATETFTGFAGPADYKTTRPEDFTVSENTAYGAVRSDGEGVGGEGVSGEGVRGEGGEQQTEKVWEEGGRENGDSRTISDDAV